MRLAGEVAIVTGAAQGLGAAIADALESEGARVGRTDIRGAEIELDVRDRASVEHAVEEVVRTLGEPTILVNNAGLSRFGPSETLPEEHWQLVVDVDLTGVFRCSQVVGARMLAAGRGAIVNIASVAAQTGFPGRVAYSAAKAGVVGLTRTLGSEWASRGVRVNAVAPGYVRTALVEHALESGFLSEEGVRWRTPAGDLAAPAQIAAAVVFLASPEASYITGETLFVDGGYNAYGAPAPASTRIEPITYT